MNQRLNRFKSRQRHRSNQITDFSLGGMTTSSLDKMRALLISKRPWIQFEVRHQPYMGHRVGTIIELDTDWGLLESGHAMFVGIHTLNISNRRSFYTGNLFETREFQSIGNRSQLTLLRREPGSSIEGATFWTQEWLQGETIVRQNVPRKLYWDRDIIEGSGEICEVLYV